jgi:hypothetical protein
MSGSPRTTSKLLDEDGLIIGTDMRLHFRGVTTALALAACAVLISCGSSPTQPTMDGCTLVSANPAAGAQLKVGVPVTVTVTAKCSLVSADSGTVVLNGIMVPSSESTTAANRPIARGTTTMTMTMTVTFTLLPGTTSVHVLMGVGTSIGGFLGDLVGLDYGAG